MSVQVSPFQWSLLFSGRSSILVFEVVSGWEVSFSCDSADTGMAFEKAIDSPSFALRISVNSLAFVNAYCTAERQVLSRKLKANPPRVSSTASLDRKTHDYAPLLWNWPIPSVSHLVVTAASSLPHPGEHRGSGT